MVESTRKVQSRDPFERFDKAIDDPRSYKTTHLRREIERVEAREADPLVQDHPENDPAPLFLTDPHDAHYQQDDRYQPNERYRKARASRILTGLLALSAVAVALALLSVDSTRAVIVNAMASLASAAPAPFGPAQPDAVPPAPRITTQSVNAEPSATPDAATTRNIQPVGLASASPSRDEIAAAYQSALKTRAVAIEPVTREAAQAARRMDPDELAALLKRAKSLLAIGDITSARLLLERAADAQEADAALMLAGTYDPQVLGTQDMRSITPDPIAARLWYQKAAELGSSDARRRLSQLQN